MGVQIIRNRAEIKDPHILALIKECVEKTKSLNYYVPDNLKFLQCKAEKRAGQASYKTNSITLSTFVYKEQDKHIKQVIYHELAHIVAGPNTHHGPVWKRIANSISRATGLNISRVYDKEDMPVHYEVRLKNKITRYRYTFRCKKCGAILHYARECKFTRTYNQMLGDKPRWVCKRCGGSFEKIEG